MDKIREAIENFQIPKLKALVLSKKALKENDPEAFRIADEILGIYRNSKTDKV